MPSVHQNLLWTQVPVIVNAPMGGIAGPQLAIEVTRAGGVGLMGMDYTASTLDEWLDVVEDSFTAEPVPLQLGETPSSTSENLPYLPIGVGFLVSFTKLDSVVEVLKQRSRRFKRPPAIFWFFAAEEPSIANYSAWAKAIRDHYADVGNFVPQIWIQVGGSAKAAVDLAQSDARPDAIVIQGSDAGGHGMERGASLIGLLPEVRELLHSAFEGQGNHGEIPQVLASGGIVDSRGALAALALGAEGVVMGTRFLASPETLVPHPEYQERVIAARDGAQSTIRAKIFDELRGPNQWPVAYDGRALVSRSWRDLHEQGASIQTIRDGHKEAIKHGDGGYGINSDRAVIWCGTGVGLVNEMRKAGDVVKDVRVGILSLADSLKNSLNISKSRL